MNRAVGVSKLQLPTCPEVDYQYTHEIIERSSTRDRGGEGRVFARVLHETLSARIRSQFTSDRREKKKNQQIVVGQTTEMPRLWTLLTLDRLTVSRLWKIWSWANSV